MHDLTKEGSPQKEGAAPKELNAPPVQFQMAPSLQSAELLGQHDSLTSDPAAAQSNNEDQVPEAFE